MATQKRSSSGKRTTTGKKTTVGGKRTAAPKKRPIRREVGGVVCLVLALCIAFSYFQQGGWLLDRPAAPGRGENGGRVGRRGGLPGGVLPRPCCCS